MLSIAIIHIKDKESIDNADNLISSEKVAHSHNLIHNHSLSLKPFKSTCHIKIVSRKP